VIEPTVLGFLGKKDARSEIWKYFGYFADSEEKPTDRQRPVCKIQTKGVCSPQTHVCKMM